jgi:hypothetical protein
LLMWVLEGEGGEGVMGMVKVWRVVMVVVCLFIFMGGG